MSDKKDNDTQENKDNSRQDKSESGATGNMLAQFFRGLNEQESTSK